MSPFRCRPSAPIFATFLALSAGTAIAGPDTWDPRLDALGVYVEEHDAAPGEWYWRLASGAYEDESESGGNHHIFFKVLDASGRPQEGREVWQAWPTGDPTDAVSAVTKGALDQYWGNHPLYGGWCPFWPEGGHGPYGAYADGPSDAVWGMGLPCNRHVNYRLVWQWTKAEEEPPPGPHLDRGDGNADGEVDLSDAIAILVHLFVSPAGIGCDDAADANDDGKVDISDPVAILGFLFTGGAAPRAPFGGCGEDPTPDDLGCGSFPPCSQGVHVR